MWKSFMLQIMRLVKLSPKKKNVSFYFRLCILDVITPTHCFVMGSNITVMNLKLLYVGFIFGKS